jgi:hypothetical protein
MQIREDDVYQSFAVQVVEVQPKIVVFKPLIKEIITAFRYQLLPIIDTIIYNESDIKLSLQTEYKAQKEIWSNDRYNDFMNGWYIHMELERRELMMSRFIETIQNRSDYIHMNQFLIGLDETEKEKLPLQFFKRYRIFGPEYLLY